MKSKSTGTMLPNGTVVIKGDVMHMNKMVCSGCNGDAIETVLPNGKKVFRCTTCGRQWVASKF